MPTCFVVQPIHPSGIRALEAAGITVRQASAADMATVAREIGDSEAVITRNAGLDAQAMAAAPRLKVIANHGVGTNKIDVARATALGIPITFTPAANARSVAEHAIMLALTVARRTVQCDAAVRAGRWDYRYEPGTQELHGKTLGLAGFGAIGRLTAAIAAQGLGMRVAVYSPSTDAASIEALGYVACQDWPTLLRQADVISLHRPSRPDTRHMINEQTLALCQPHAILVNTARADLVDTEALARALSAGQLAGAGIDVFDQEPVPADSVLRSLPQVVLTPHSAGSTDEALQATADQCAEQIIAVLAGTHPGHLVAPDVWDRRR